jgi:hypothetical protein
MKVIAHRANLYGPNIKTENTISSIEECFSKNIDVEIDIWYLDEYFIGHDISNLQKIDINFLKINSDRLWIHAKNIFAVEKMITNNLHWFWHETDKLTLTSKNKIWCYPGIYTKDGITVELGERKLIPSVLGVCTDYPVSWL